MLTPAFVVTGAPAVIIIVVIVALFLTGVVTFFRLTARGVKRVVDHDGGRDRDRIDRTGD